MEALPKRHYDGWGKWTPYAPQFGERMEWKKPEGKTDEEAEDDLVTYYGNCHCGKIRYALRSKNLDDLEVMQCNCSMCGKVSSRLSILYPKSQYPTFKGGSLELGSQILE